MKSELNLKQWHVYRFNQELSRKKTSPKQPLDDWRPYRRFVIITPQLFISDALRVTCVPIGEKCFSDFLHVPLAKGEARCSKICHVWANEIYTLEKKWFDFEYGPLPEAKIDLLGAAIRDYLGF